MISIGDEFYEAPIRRGWSSEIRWLSFGHALPGGTSLTNEFPFLSLVAPAKAGVQDAGTTSAAPCSSQGQAPDARFRGLADFLGEALARARRKEIRSK